MPRKALLITFIGSLAVIIMVAASMPATPHAAADQLLQGVPRLDGYRIYFSESAGEASRFDRTTEGLSRFAGLLELQGAQLYTLEWRNGIPADADLIVIAGLGGDLNAQYTAWLWDYLQDGGRLLFLVDPRIGKTGIASASGIFELLWTDMGLRGRNDLVMAESGETIEVIPPTPRAARDQATPTPPPPVSVPRMITQFATGNINASHPIGAGFTDTLTFFGARSLESDEAPRQSQVTSLVFTDSNFYGETDFTTYLSTGYVEYNIGTDTGRGNLVLASALENTVTGTRMIFIGDRQFALNGYGLQTSPSYSGSFLYPGNVRFLLRAAAWLLDADMTDTVELTFPTPGPTSTPTITPSPTPLPTATPVPDAGESGS
ncbi:MAG: hypothetical protein JXA10_09920 [Anaerolineae bacterium]|nr:hypothetical protein [Anaerolineae bacterium]